MTTTGARWQVSRRSVGKEWALMTEDGHCLGVVWNEVGPRGWYAVRNTGRGGERPCASLQEAKTWVREGAHA